MTTTFAKLLAAALIVSTAAPALAAQVDHREAHQQGRIAQGIESGRLTPRESARLERKEARVHQQIHRERRAKGGRLTRAERRHVRHEQNHLSRRIYGAKHDGRHA